MHSVNKRILIETAQHSKTRADRSPIPPTKYRKDMSGCEDNWRMCCLSGQREGQTLPSFVPFIMLTPSSGTKKGDSSNTCWTWGGWRWEGEALKWGRWSGNGKMRAPGSQGTQHWNGLIVIYCNGSSSRGALYLKGLINSLRGINKVSFIFQGVPWLSITILSPPHEPSLISQDSDNNTFPLVSVLPATALNCTLLSFFASCFTG